MSLSVVASSCRLERPLAVRVMRLAVLWLVFVVVTRLQGSSSPADIDTLGGDTDGGVAIKATVNLETIIRQQVQARFANATNYNIPPYYFLHTPKAAGTAMNHQLKERFGVPMRRSSPKTPIEQVVRKWNWNQRLAAMPGTAGGPKIYSNEGYLFDPTTTTASGLNTLIMVRNPRHHIISQYSHCTESIYANSEYQAQLKSIGLEGWLDYHLQGLDEEMNRTDFTNPAWAKRHWPGTLPTEGDPTYHCYIPINHQSWKLHRPTSAMQVASTYKVVGVVDHLETSACLFAIFATYPKQAIPRSCLCTGSSNNNMSPALERVDHGVTSHGDQVEVSEQVQAKLDALSELDQQLYEWAKEIFVLQKQAVEDILNIQLC